MSWPCVSTWMNSYRSLFLLGMLRSIRHHINYAKSKLTFEINYARRKITNCAYIIARCRFNVYAAERYAPRTRPAKLLLKEAQLKASARFFFLFTERLPCLVLRRISVLVVASHLDSNYVKTSFLS